MTYNSGIQRQLVVDDVMFSLGIHLDKIVDT